MAWTYQDDVLALELAERELLEGPVGHDGLSWWGEEGGRMRRGGQFGRIHQSSRIKTADAPVNAGDGLPIEGTGCEALGRVDKVVGEWH